MTLAACGTSGTIVEHRDFVSSEGMRATRAERDCFEETLDVPDKAALSRKENLRLWKQAAAMDARKTACGRKVLKKLDDVVDLHFGNAAAAK